MGEQRLTIDQLEHKIKSLSNEALGQYIVENIETLFSATDFSKYYKVLKNTEIEQLRACMPRIILAWFAFLCGDHSRCFKIIGKVTETDLDSAEASSLFYSLKALLSGMLNTDEAHRYAKLSIDVLEPNEKNIYMANALLTYGQIYSGTDQYTQAAEKFLASYETFISSDLPFLASTAFVNYTLNLYKIGKYQAVIEACQTLLLKESNVSEGIHDFWNIVHLPQGLCYYELGKLNLAADHLTKAKDTIDSLGLIHMHGMVELYLYKTYFILNDENKMKTLKNETTQKLSNMNHPMMNMFVILFTLYNTKDVGQHQAMIEKLEAEFLKGNQDSYSVLNELLVFLKLKGTSDVITTDYLKERLNYFKKINNISMLQLTSIQLAELFMLDDKSQQANVFLDLAINLYQDYRICSSFYLIPLKSITQIKKQDEGLYKQIIKYKPVQITEDSLLTAREKDILKLIDTGKTNKQLSEELFISVGTIKWHLNNIFSKLYVKNRIQAVKKAKELNEI